MRSLKILISHTSVYNNAGWGRIFPLATGLVKQGHRVTILTTNPKFSLITKRKVINNVDIIIYPEIVPMRISKMGFGFLSLFLKIIHSFFNRYDVVQSDNGHRPLAGIPCRINKRRFGSVYVAEWYDWYGKGGQYDAKKKLFKLLLGWYELKYEIKDKKVADGVVVLSEVLRNRAEQFKPKERIRKIHGGADVDSIPYLKDNSQLKKKYSIDSEVLTFGYITSNSYNLAEFSPLIDAISKSEHSRKIKILIFGESNSIASQLKPETMDLFMFMGWIDFSRDYEKLQCVDTFFLFKEESLGNKAGWPNCIGDYLACGRPVLLNPVGEVVDFAKKYPIAFLETTRESESILSKIEYLDENISRIKEEGVTIRKLAENIVSWEAKSEELSSFYFYLLENKAV
ncbi:MAG TPA: hypothetical protein DCG75_13695 [Bacteroidales bacterium]|nr:hypothetical protein [Bacteroidales bacterium]